MQPQQPLIPQAPMPSNNQPVSPDYNFIVNPPEVTKKPRSLPGGGSLLGKVVIVAIGLAVLMIVFVVIKSVTAKPSSMQYFLAVAQDQQALVHYSQAAIAQTGTTTSTKNSAVTINMSVGSSQQLLNAYLKKNGTTLDAKKVGLKVTAKTDDTLTSAAGAGIYGQTYKTVMQDLLNGYSDDLKIAYAHSPGKIGQKLLTDDFNGAQLLLTQLNN